MNSNQFDKPIPVRMKKLPNKSLIKTETYHKGLTRDYDQRKALRLIE
jgi:hypothetical protein